MDKGTLDLVIKTINEYSKRKLTLDFKLKCDGANEFPSEVIRELVGSDIGLHLVFIPEEYGGLGGTAYDIYRVSAALAEADLGIATAFLAISLGMDPISVGGTPEQKEKWIGAVASEGLIVAYGVTEPTAGSEVSSIRTTAERISDGSGRTVSYRLNGTKQFITNGSVADLFTILARAPEGPSFFIIEKGTPGLGAGRHEDKHGIRASNTAQVVLEDVVVPAENLVGGVEGQGLRHAQEVFGFTRLMVAAFGLGAGTAALRRAIGYSKERVQYGSPLCRKQGYMHRLIVPNAVRLEAARTYIEAVAGRLDAGQKGLETEGAIAKYLATEAGNEAAEASIQAHGGYGYMREYEVEKIKRDVRITTIYEGTSEIMLNTMGMDRWRSTIQSRFGYYAGLEEGMTALDARCGGIGARHVALASKVLNETLKVAFREKLTRKQFILFKMAEMMAAVESAASLCERARLVEEGEKEDGASLFTDGAFHPGLIPAMARLYARSAASTVLVNANLAVTGTGILDAGRVAEFRRESGLQKLLEAAEGAEADMDIVAGCINA
jgi:alkylation response protein AidB-like acyl-CoA dehydrogenase